MDKLISINPEGIEFPLPKESDYDTEFTRVEKLVSGAQKSGQEIIVVMGIGFVGSVMAAIVADTVDKNSNPSKFVIGLDLPTKECYWKISMINNGQSPVKADDTLVSQMINQCVLKKKTLTATYNQRVIQFADVVIIDVQCDYIKPELGNVKSGKVEMKALEDSFKTIGEHMNPKTLVLIETTVPPGTTEHIAYPIIKKIFLSKGFVQEPLLAHSFERVMPGKNYVASVRDFWRVCSGINNQSRDRVTTFLNEVLNTTDFPLTVLDKPIESETAKIVENSYRATILAFMDEWSLFAERNGVDILKVIDAVKIRPTHSNLVFPGPGIGGYCLPKDGGLGYWAYKHILGFEDDIFKITTAAIDINDTRALHAAELVRDALKEMNTSIAAANILVLGASYREGVADTRYSGSEVLIRKLVEMGAEIHVHDPYVHTWKEFKNQDSFPSVSKKKFFRNQENLTELLIEKNLFDAIKGKNAIVFAVKHSEYLDINPDKILELSGQPIAVIDCFGFLNDKTIEHYLKLGCTVKGLGRGHINRIKESIH